MKLYHGTTEAVARAVIETGLVPRGKDGSQNWEHTVPSNPNCVYLTEVYAGYFALTAAKDVDDKWGIIEVDTDNLHGDLLCPDEDTLEQASRHDPDVSKDLKGLDMLERTLWFRERIQEYRHLWKASLEAMGTCAYYGTIGPEAISRIAIYDPKSNGQMTMNCMDPSITLMNFKFVSAKYRMMTRWLMGDEITAKEWIDESYSGHPYYEEENIAEWLADKDIKIVYKKGD